MFLLSLVKLQLHLAYIFTYFRSKIMICEKKYHVILWRNGSSEKKITLYFEGMEVIMEMENRKMEMTNEKLYDHNSPTYMILSNTCHSIFVDGIFST